MPTSTHEDRYVEASARMNSVTAIAAMMIIALMVSEVWGDWPAFKIVVGVELALMAFNMWVTLVLLKRRGIAMAETLRTAMNLTGITVIGLTAGFPFAMWLWLPFHALTFDHGGRRVVIGITCGFALVLDLLAFYQGLHWIYPVAIDAFTVMCLLISRARSATIREMLLRSDEQRHQLEQAHHRLVEEVKAREQVELELRQAQKLEAIGRLASGIAHEINTPVQFVSDSVHFVDDATRDLLTLAARTHVAVQTLLEGSPVPDVLAAVKQAEDDADLAYVAEQLPAAVTRVLDGLERISTIVRSMKEFAHPDLQHVVAADLNRALLATITIAAHEYRQVADVDFDPGELPLVVCRPGEINQVFLNLLVNAAHAIGDVVEGTARRGRITIHTRPDGDHVVVSIADTGGGIPDSVRGRIFDPFYTTKAVGRGTGQGLAIARNVVKHHGGTLTFETEVGSGTTFVLRLPVAGVGAAVEAIAA